MVSQAFSETEIQFKLENVQKIWQRFLYRDSILLEAERQKSTIGHVDDWAVELSQLSEDDVFATLIQVIELLYMLSMFPPMITCSYENYEPL